MRASAKLFYAIAVFLGISGVVYVFGTVWIEDDGWKYRYDWAGGIPLLLSSLMAIMLGAYLHITESRSDVLPEDWEEAEISDSAGVLHVAILDVDLHLRIWPWCYLPVLLADPGWWRNAHLGMYDAEPAIRFA